MLPSFSPPLHQGCVLLHQKLCELICADYIEPYWLDTVCEYIYLAQSDIQGSVKDLF